MRTLLPAFLLLGTLSLLSSCIPRQKYDQALLSSSQYKKSRDSLRTVADENRYAQYDLDRRNQELSQLQEDLKDNQDKLQNLQRSQNDIQQRYDELLEQNKLLLSNSSSDVQQLTNKISEKQAILDAKDREVRSLQAEIAQLQGLVQDKEAEITAALGADQGAEYQAQIQELQAALSAKEAALGNLRSNLNQALHSFSSTDLTVSEANGKIYVSLSQNLLFASGSNRLDWKGKRAIQTLAGVLKDNPNVEVNVEGHTDTDGSAAQNWDLSVRRATAVAQVLVSSGVDPKRVIASGRAFYQPIASNGTAAGKAQNRRTEIILSPKLDQLYDLINN
ncbi:MAG: OmpA family protein [Bacteroidota bacterium]